MNSFHYQVSLQNSSRSKIHNKNHKTSTPQTQDKTILMASDYNDKADKKLGLDICQQHLLQYSHICLNCQNQCLCKSCLANGEHSYHEMKTIKKGYLQVKSNLNEYLIRIRTKCDLLSLLCEIKKNDQIQQYQRLEKQKHQIQKSFESVITTLKLKKAEIIDSLETQYQANLENSKKILTQIRVNIKKSMDLHKDIEKAINQYSPIQICRYYELSLMKIKDFATQTKVQQFKRHFTNINYKFNYFYLNQLIESIANMKFYKTSCDKQKEKCPKKKIRKISKAPFGQRNNKCRLSHPTLANFNSMPSSKQKKRFTKNIKIIEQQYTLRQVPQRSNEKMLSMPVSPKKQRHESSPIINMELQKKIKTKIRH